MFDALREHWPEYLMEGAELGLFMISACAFTVLLFHPASVVAQNIHSEIFRRMLMGVAMGSTAIAIIFSPLGKRSGGHFNPSVTLTFFRLGKIKAWDDPAITRLNAAVSLPSTPISVIHRSDGSGTITAFGSRALHRFPQA